MVFRTLFVQFQRSEDSPESLFIKFMWSKTKIFGGSAPATPKNSQDTHNDDRISIFRLRMIPHLRWTTTNFCSPIMALFPLIFFKIYTLGVRDCTSMLKHAWKWEYSMLKHVPACLSIIKHAEARLGACVSVEHAQACFSMSWKNAWACWGMFDAYACPETCFSMLEYA